VCWRNLVLTITTCVAFSDASRASDLCADIRSVPSSKDLMRSAISHNLVTEAQNGVAQGIWKSKATISNFKNDCKIVSVAGSGSESHYGLVCYSKSPASWSNTIDLYKSVETKLQSCFPEPGFVHIATPGKYSAERGPGPGDPQATPSHEVMDLSGGLTISLSPEFYSAASGEAKANGWRLSLTVGN